MKNTFEKYLIKSGRVIDPGTKRDGIFDILISDGRIEEIAKELKRPGCEAIDAKGKIVCPGLIDMHVHLREPGREDEETVSSGTSAAVKGGFTKIACMPNTEPAMDNPSAIKALQSIIKKDANCGVIIVGAMTEGRKGLKVCDFESVRKDVPAVSDDGSSVDDERAMLEVLKFAKKNSILAIAHCEDRAISEKGVINEGFISTKMGLRAIPRRAEYERVKRDIFLAEKTGARLHIAHVSLKESVDIIRQAKKKGMSVTAETAPHYFSLTDECAVTYDTNTKMNPPLRTRDDVEAIKRGLSDGTIDAIASDHAPHTDSEKHVEFDHAPFGIIGLETSLALSIMALVDTKVLSWPELIKKMSLNPARILGIDSGIIKKGASGDITIIDPDKIWVYSENDIRSRSKNSPFIGWQFRGCAVYTIVSGRIVMRNGNISDE